MNRERDYIMTRLLREIQTMEVDRSIEMKIDEFGDLSDSMDRMKDELNRIKQRYSELEDELRPVMEELDEQHRKSLKTNRFLLTIKRKGYNRNSFKYKESFEKSLTKVNKQTRKLLEELLQSTKTTSRVLTSLGVQPIMESSLWNRIKSKVGRLFGKLFTKLKQNDRELNRLYNLTKEMI